MLAMSSQSLVHTPVSCSFVDMPRTTMDQYKTVPKTCTSDELRHTRTLYRQFRLNSFYSFSDVSKNGNAFSQCTARFNCYRSEIIRCGCVVHPRPLLYMLSLYQKIISLWVPKIAYIHFFSQYNFSQFPIYFSNKRPVPISADEHLSSYFWRISLRTAIGHDQWQMR